MKRWILENLGLKMLAVLVAVGLWAYVGSRQIYMERRTIPVEFRDMPQGMTLDSGARTSVPVVLTGRTESFKELDRDDLKAVVSLKAYVSGQREMTVHPKVQPLPSGIKVELQDILVPLLPLKEPKARKKK
jgi:hypothetical protein